jgi:hypothetical protein
VLDGIYPYITFMVIQNTMGMYHSNIKANLVFVAMTPFSKTMGEEMNNKYWLSSESTP